MKRQLSLAALSLILSSSLIAQEATKQSATQTVPVKKEEAKRATMLPADKRTVAPRRMATPTTVQQPVRASVPQKTITPVKPAEAPAPKSN